MTNKKTVSQIYIKLKSKAEKKEAYSIIDAQKRRSLTKDWHINGMKPKARADHKRAIEEIVRKPKKYSADRARLTTNDLVLYMREKRDSKVLDHLYPERKRPEIWIKYSKRKKSSNGESSEINLHNFSFLDEPEKCLEGITQIAKYEAKERKVRINFKDKYCRDIVPYMLLTEFWDEMLPVFKGGEMRIPMQKVLAAIGIEEDLNVGFPGIKDFEDVWAFPLTRRRRTGSSGSKNIYFDVPSRDHASDRFCEALDEWLNRPEINLELTQRGRGHIKELLGELLENAERHSDGDRKDGSWTVAGFLAKRKVDEKERFIAHIGIVSLGDTFAESLKRAPIGQKTNINDYLDKMAKMKAPQSRETLKTLAALQDGVTCVSEADKEGRGGYGLMQMLELTNTLGATDEAELQPEITIVSGPSCVQLKDPYFMCEIPTGKNGSRVQWCNSKNSANVVPDEKHVFDLKKGLPGTAISIRFILDPQYLQKMMEK